MAQKLKDIEKAKQPNWIWENVIKEGTVNLLSGEESKGKSMLMLQFVKHTLKCRRGQTFLGYGVHPCKTLYISTEMTADELKNRLHLIGITGRLKATNENFSIYCNPMPTLEDIKREIEESGADLIIIDIFVGLISGEQKDINSYVDMNLVAAQLKKFNKTFVLIHHLNKKKETLGSVGVSSSMDARMVMLESSRDNENGEVVSYQTVHIYGKGVTNRYVDVVFKFPNFELAPEANDADELDKPLAKIVQTVITKQQAISGTYQQVAAECQLIEKFGFNPKKMGLYLKMNTETLNNNDIFFTTKRKTNGYYLTIWYDPDHTEATEISEAPEVAATLEDFVADENFTTKVAETTEITAPEDDEYEY